MRALVCKEYGPPESMVIEERNDPVPGDGQILVDIKAAGINFPDVLSIAGKYQVKTPTPFVPGNEAAGIVSAVSPGVTQYAVGDKIIINTMGGAFAEKCVADVHMSAPLPDDAQGSR
jgi:NADPH2:quinone reductase